MYDVESDMENGNEPATKADIQTITAYLQAVMAKVDTLATDVQGIKTDVHVLRSDFDQKLEALEARINQKIEDQDVNWNTRFLSFEHRMEQRVTEMEGRIIATVYRLMDSGNQRLTAAERDAMALKERMATLENRLLLIEQRLETPPRS
jgi:outer membrane murein-binding lipoprotein Lpp